MSNIVIALGGNALGDTPQEQLRLVRETAKAVVDLAQAGHRLVVVHGNGPQVGMIQKGLAYAAEHGAVKSEMPLAECGAMSQGYIGFHLQTSIQNELTARAMQAGAVCLVTQVLVEEDDPAFENPTKPIGNFYSREQAERLTREEGWVMKEDAGRGYRRVVPSPVPVDVVEKDAISALSREGQIVIAAGGGGIPVVLHGGRKESVPAVIDKDLASAKLAELIGADTLIILTAVDAVAIHFGTPQQQSLASMSVAEAKEYIAQGEFAPGSMLPKVQAAVQFAEKGGTALIASLSKAAEAVQGKSGTRIFA